MGILQNVILKAKAKKKAKRDASLARSQGVSEGYLSCSAETVNSIQKLNTRVEDLTQQLADTEVRIRMTYKQQQEEAEKRQRDACKICLEGVNAERKKLITLQDEFRDALGQFRDYEKRLSKFVTKFETTFSNMLQGMGRLNDSEEELGLIAKDFRSFVKKNEKLIELNTRHP